MSTDKKLEEVAREYVENQRYEVDHDKDYWSKGEMVNLESEIKDGFIAGANYVKEMASEGFEEWVESEDTTMHPSGREGCFANNNNFTRDYWIAEKAWQAATLSSQKRIEELEKKLEIAEKKIKSFDAYVMRDEKLSIAVSALEKCKKIRRKDGNEYKGSEAIISEEALKKIKGEDA
jgi:hypothetical protein